MKPRSVWHRPPSSLGGVAASSGSSPWSIASPAAAAPSRLHDRRHPRDARRVTVGAARSAATRGSSTATAIKTAPDGRARVRLDDGTLLVVDGSTELELGRRARHARSRAASSCRAARARTPRWSSAARPRPSRRARPRSTPAPVARLRAKIYCARGELVVAAPQDIRCTSRAERPRRSRRRGPKVAPEKAFDDWTGGLAVPWAGETGQASAIPTPCGAARSARIPGSALVVRSAKIDVDIQGEVAVTRTRTTYFNGSDREVPAEVTARAARGGHRLARRARRREQARGRRRAASRAPPRRRRRGAAGSSGPAAAGCGARSRTSRPARRSTSLVDYVEWLPERGGRATYRFPMASEGDPPMIGELAARVHDDARPRRPLISTSAGATVERPRA